MKRRSFLAMAATMPLIPSLLSASPSMVSSHPYMGKPFISMALPKRMMELKDSRIMSATKSRAVLVRDIPKKTSRGEDMVEVVIPKPTGPHHPTGYLGFPQGGAYMSESIIDLEDQKVLKHRTYGSQENTDTKDLIYDHFGEA